MRIQRQRKLLSPAFAYRHVKELYPIFWAKAQEMARLIDETNRGESSTNNDDGTPTTESSNDGEKKAERVVIDVGSTVSRATLDIIGLAGFEQDFNAIADPSNKLYKTYQAVFNPTGAARILGIISLFIPFWLLRSLPLKRNADLQNASKFIRQTCMDMIQTKKAKLEKGESVGVDVLSIALKSGGFKDEELVDQLMTFAAAGHETTVSFSSSISVRPPKKKLTRLPGLLNDMGNVPSLQTPRNPNPPPRGSPRRQSPLSSPRHQYHKPLHNRRRHRPHPLPLSRNFRDPPLLPPGPFYNAHIRHTAQHHPLAPDPDQHHHHPLPRRHQLLPPPLGPHGRHLRP